MNVEYEADWDHIKDESGKNINDRKQERWQLCTFLTVVNVQAESEDVRDGEDEQDGQYGGSFFPKRLLLLLLGFQFVHIAD